MTDHSYLSDACFGSCQPSVLHFSARYRFGLLECVVLLSDDFVSECTLAVKKRKTEDVQTARLDSTRLDSTVMVILFIDSLGFQSLFLI